MNIDETAGEEIEPGVRYSDLQFPTRQQMRLEISRLLKREAAQLIETEDLKAGLREAAIEKAHGHRGNARCGHNGYWTGVFGGCMVCRAEKAERAVEVVATLHVGTIEQLDESHAREVGLEEKLALQATSSTLLRELMADGPYETEDGECSFCQFAPNGDAGQDLDDLEAHREACLYRRAKEHIAALAGSTPASAEAPR